MGPYTIETIHKGRVNGLGEGPVWLKDSNEWGFVDIIESKFVKLEYQTNEWREITIPGIKSLSLSHPTTSPDYFVGLAAHDVIAYDWNKPEDFKIIASVEQGMNTRFNDGTADRSGRLWAGTMGEEIEAGIVPSGLGVLYSMDIDNDSGKVSPIKQAYPENFDLSNGIDWSTDNQTMFFIDSPKREIFSFNYDENTGKLSNKQAAISFTNCVENETIGQPDGCTMDANNKLWVACFFGSCICKFDVETGKLIERFDLHSRDITSCIFGGPYLNQLFVTADGRGSYNEGSVYRIDGLDGTKGLPVSLLNAPNV